ncbi:MAG: ABC transporter substrate-binding protein [Burkholderiales bacterium]|nr:ABC transporter substrate-binding protein [Burkholderiales bacterium]
MKSIVRLVLVGLLGIGSIAWAQSSPDALVKRTVDEVLAVVRQNQDPKALLALAEQKVLPYFDFTRMTRLAVGRPWREASPSQQQALVSAFRSVLVNTYSAAISNGVTPADKIDVKSAQGGGDDVVVKTVAHRSGKPPIAVDYRLSRNGEGWKVYDVVVENVSLVQTYRGSFAEEIARSGIDGLIKVLEHKAGAQQVS